MKRLLAPLFGFLVAVMLVGRAGATTIEFDGLERQFEMYVPPTAPRPLPVVLLLHGGTSTAEQIRRYTGFDALAAREGILAVYPQGVAGQWNDGRPQTGMPHPLTADTDDVGFLLALVDELVGHGLADPRRIYVAGIASGGMMALRLACEHPERIAAAAVVAANQPSELNCTPTRPVPMIFFHGTRDRFVPFGGGDILQWANVDRGKVLSAHDTVEQWRKIDGCTGEPNTHRVGASGAVAVDLVTYEPCSGAEVRHFVMKGGGHTWPGAHQGPAGDKLLGPAAGINANEEIWKFFDAQPPR